MTKPRSRTPDQEQIDYWINVSLRSLDTTRKDWERGYYVQRGIPSQDVFSCDGLTYSGLARAKFLNGEPIKDVRSTFREAALSSLRALKIVYDSSDELFKPDNSDYCAVAETPVIRGFNYALMAGDFTLAKYIADWFQQSPDGSKMDPEVNDFAFGLKYTLQNEDKMALAILKPRLEKYLKKPPKGGYKRNYHTVTTALLGILEQDQALFNEGLEMQLKFHKGQIPSEYKNTDEEFICDDAVALANLGLHRGLNVTVENDRLPPGLLIEKAP